MPESPMFSCQMHQCSLGSSWVTGPVKMITPGFDLLNCIATSSCQPLVQYLWSALDLIFDFDCIVTFSCRQPNFKHYRAQWNHWLWLRSDILLPNVTLLLWFALRSCQHGCNHHQLKAATLNGNGCGQSMDDMSPSEWVSIFFRPDLRKGFLAAAVPIFLKGIKGPGAPHFFQFTQRRALGGPSLWMVWKAESVSLKFGKRLENKQSRSSELWISKN